MAGWDHLDQADRREQFKLIYDYIKFHIAMYLATPAAIGVLGRSFDVEHCPAFRWGLGLMICVFFVAGAHASWFMGTHINSEWEKSYLDDFQADAFTCTRRFMHHWLYWLGLLSGLVGLAFATFFQKHCH